MVGLIGVGLELDPHPARLHVGERGLQPDDAGPAE